MTPFWRGVLEAAAALGFIALVFTWLLKRLVVRKAGESEPLYFHSYWGSALPLRGPLRIAFAVAVGVCAGAVVRSIFDTAVFNRSATRSANQANLQISVQTKPAKCQAQDTE